LSILPAAVLLVGLVACGEEPMPVESGCALESRADTYVQGLEKKGNVFTVSLLEAKPGPPERGENEWTFELSKDELRVDTATISVKPWMPDHGHGTTPLFFDAKRPQPDQAFDLGPFDFFMPGYWTLTFSIESESITDEVIFGFCIEG